MKPKPRKYGLSEEQQVFRMYKNIKNEKRIVQRWCAGNEASVSTNGSGIVALATLANAASASSTSDFASFAGLYTTYRVKALRVDLFPVSTCPVWNGTGVASQPSVVAVFPSFANTVPTTFQQALDVTGVKLLSGYKGGTVVTSWKGDPDAHLWTGTGSAIGNNEQFLISIIGTALATTSASAVVFRCIPQYLIEFRIAG